MEWTAGESADRRAFPRVPTSAHVMVMLGQDNAIYDYGTVLQVSTGGLVISTEIAGHTARVFRDGLLLVGMEPWCRHFSISCLCRRVTPEGHLVCTILSVSSDEFLASWIAREARP